MSNQRSLTLLLGAVAVVCVIAAALRFSEAKPNKGRAPSDSIEGRSNRAVAQEPPSLNRDVVPAASASVAVAVLDGDGKGLRGAVLTRNPTISDGSRHAVLSAENTLGATSDSGVFAVTERHFLGLDKLSLTARMPGYQMSALTLDRSMLGRRVDIVLLPALQLVMHCVTRGGQPVKGVQVSVSPAMMPSGGRSEVGFADRVPIGSPEQAIHSAVSDVFGVARVDGLPAQRLFLQAYHEAYVLVDGMPGGAGVLDLNENEEVRVVFDPLVGAIATVDDDDVLAWSSQIPNGLWIGSSFSDRLAGVQDKWMSAYPRAMFLVAVPKFEAGVYTKDLGFAVFDVFAASRGLTTVRAPVRPIMDLSAPEQHLIGSGETVSALVTPYLRTPSGHRVDCLAGFRLQPIVEGARVPLWVPLNVAGPRLLPVGDYRVVTSQPTLRKVLRNLVVSVASAGDLVIDVPLEVRPCSITWRSGSGVPLDAGEVSIESGGEEYRISKTQRLAGSIWLLPVGKATVSIVSAVGSLLDQQIEIDPGSSVLELDMGAVR